MLRERTTGEPARLVAAGYLPPEHQPYLEEIRRQLREWGLEGEFDTAARSTARRRRHSCSR